MRNALLLSAALFVAGCAGEGVDTSVATSGTPTVEEIRFTDKDQTTLSGDVALAARDYVRATPELTVSAEDDWNVRGARMGLDGKHHVRLEQLHGGVKVWG